MDDHLSGFCGLLFLLQQSAARGRKKVVSEKGLLKELSGNALKLYIYLGIYSKNETGESWHSVERIAEYFDCDKRTITRWFKELEDKELIFRVQKGYKRAANTFLKPY